MEEKKNTVLLIVIAIATLVVAVVGATFAYFASSTTSTGNLTVNAVTGKTATFVSSASDTINLNITSDKMQKGGTYGEIDNSNGSVEITYTAGGDTATSCTYDILYVWDSETVLAADTAGDSGANYIYAGGNGYTLPYTDPDTSTVYNHEFSLTVVATDDGNEPAGQTSSIMGETGAGYLVNGTETEITTLGTTTVDPKGENESDADYNARYATALAKLQSRTIIKNATIWATTKSHKVTYKFTAKFYNLPADQSMLSDKMFTGHFEVVSYC